jgi:transposase-like protein
MGKYTPEWLFWWFDLGLPAWLRLLLAVSMCLVPGGTDSQPRALDPTTPWYLAQGLRPRYWGSRWGWSARILWRSRWRILARCVLVLTLRELSGVTDTLPGVRYWVWVPVIEGALNAGACLGWRGYWKHVYRDVQRGVRLVYQGSVVVLGVLSLARLTPVGGMGLGLGKVLTCEQDESHVKLERMEEPGGQPTYRVELSGDLVLVVTPRDAFELRMLILFLRRLRAPRWERSSRGIVRQEALAAVCAVTQEEISRWEKYLREGRWAELLSVATSSWLNEDRCQEIVGVWAANIWQTAQEVRARLAERGVRVALRTVEEAGRRSGLQQVRHHVKQQYTHTAGGVQLRDKYVMAQLFEVVEELERRVQGAEVPQEERVDVTALRQWVEREAPAPQPEKAWSWWWQMEHWLLGAWQDVVDESVHCPYCGTTQVARKSRTPRLKAYLDAQGQRQTVEVYRYYCKNPECTYQSFTNLPAGQVLHSVWSVDARLKGLELYMGLGSTYRRVAAALDVTPSTLYHWLAAWGAEPLQVAALFGMVRSSGVVGIDEKYVKVPKNDKAPGKYRKWMYVYVAVDMHTLDLLHIAVFPQLGQASARTFLLELRTKGYHPQVIVTDLCADYAVPLAAVFPDAEHHECLFHALQAWHRQFRQIYGSDYTQTAPDIFALRQRLDAVFRVKTRRTVQKRYAQWQAECAQHLQQDSRLQPIVDSVARHFPLIVNAYDRPMIPLTNNATERLIRRFDQHYQNFAGFDSLSTARVYVHLFELVYRFTPFGDGATPHLRGRCPLELAGYDLSQLTLARYLREHGKQPLLPLPQEVVPG